MQYQMIVTGKDNVVYEGINMMDKSLIAGKFLQEFIDVKDVKQKLSAGDVVVLSETENFFKSQIVSIQTCNIETRLENIKKAYCQWLNCADARSYTLENNQEDIAGRKFTDLQIFCTANEILSAYKKVLNEYQKTQGCLPSGVDLKKITKLIKNMRTDAVKVIGVEFDSYYGFNRETINRVLPLYREQYGLNEQTDGAILELIHSQNLKYLKQLGQEVLGTKCNEKEK